MSLISGSLFSNSNKNASQETPSLDNSLMNLEDDEQMARYCFSLDYKTDNCKKWAARVGKTLYDGDKQIDQLEGYPVMGAYQQQPI
jgi:hypothetical protein